MAALQQNTNLGLQAWTSLRCYKWRRAMLQSATRGDRTRVHRCCNQATPTPDATNRWDDKMHKPSDMPQAGRWLLRVWRAKERAAPTRPGEGTQAQRGEGFATRGTWEEEELVEEGVMLIQRLRARPSNGPRGNRSDEPAGRPALSVGHSSKRA